MKEFIKSMIEVHGPVACFLFAFMLVLTVIGICTFSLGFMLAAMVAGIFGMFVSLINTLF
jgi:hypothetical protein